MISRYDSPEISAIWTDLHKFETYLQVELAVLQALEKDIVPKGVSAAIAKSATINPLRIDEIEKITRHDIIAFCTSITENIAPEIGKYFHFGVTSSDIIDTSLTIQIKESLEAIIPLFEELLTVLKCKALEFKDIVAMGRSHGMYAEPLSFGQKFLGHYAEFQRRFEEYKTFYATELTGQLSGAVGNYTIISPSHEKQALKTLGLKVEPVSTQVIPRDRIAKLITLGALTASAIERLAVEIRHLHRSEVFELHEGFAKGQKGSSTMPHKKNPISAENLTGMARFLRSHVSMALENIVLWHERDISHSSSERMYLPDHFGILFYSLKRLKSTISNLIIHQDVIEKRVEDNFIYLSSFYLHKLIEQTNLNRDELYAITQTAAFEARDAQDFYNSLLSSLAERGLNVVLPNPNFEEIKKIYLASAHEVFHRTMKN